MKKLILSVLAIANFLYAKDISVGVVLPLTGTMAAYGQDIYNGIELANKLQPKLSNKDTVKLITIDTKGDKLETSNGVNRLIATDKVHSIRSRSLTDDSKHFIGCNETIDPI